MRELDSGPVDSNDSVDLGAIILRLWAWRYLIASATVIGASIALFFALTAPLVYRSQVVIIRVNDSGMSGSASLISQFGGLANLAGVNIGRGGADQDAYATLESRHLVEVFISRNDLLSVLSSDANKPLTLWKAVEKFKKSIVSIGEDKRSGTITVAMSWNDPNVAARWANDFVALANEMVRTRALDDATRNISYLNAQISKTNVVELQKVMYSLVENETKTLMLANARQQFAFNVIDPAVAPEQRIKPQRTLMVMGGAIAGMILAIVIALAQNAVLVQAGRKPTA